MIDKMKDRPVHRDLSLDVLRGIAIMLVLNAHMNHPVPSGWLSHWVTNQQNLIGPVGVDLFFVLSGFLIGGLLFKELRRF